MLNKKSRLTNCHLHPRKSQKNPMFSFSNKEIIIDLDNYLIIPRETFAAKVAERILQNEEK